MLLKQHRSLKNTRVWYRPKLIYVITILLSQLIIEPSLNFKERIVRTSNKLTWAPLMGSYLLY